MATKRKDSKIIRDLSELWRDIKKEVGGLSVRADKLLNKGEKYLKSASKNIKEKSDTLVMMAKREQLYYNLGKAVADRDTRKAATLRRKIASISKKIKK